MEFCTLPFIASLFGACATPLPMASGYVEGQFVLLAPVEIAQIAEINLSRGDRYESGMVLVELEQRDAEIAVAQARAGLALANSKLQNISHGRRPEEIAVIEASLRSAQLQAEDALREFERQKTLFERGVIAKARLDIATTQSEVNAARVVELEANLSVAKLPARAGEIAAAEAVVAQAEATLDNAQWRLGKRALTVNGRGVVFDVLRNRGEIAGPQAPVLSLLPDGAIKLQVYVPQNKVADIHIGAMLQVGCDGCPTDLTAEVTYVSDEPEFTPPVIYSIENRQKLVFLVEAKPSETAYRLKPGQIVNVDLAAPEQ